MTFTEAAVEVLRRAGKPLHYKEIAEAAVRENLLSHVGQDPETTMGQRLAAMARREEERRVVAIAPDGTFALTEWSVPAELVVEAKPPPVLGDDGQPPYRAREREPRPIHSQARRRMEAIAAGEEPGDAEKRERQETRDRERQERQDRKRPAVAAEAVFDWLAQRQSGAPLAEAAAELASKGLISEGLAHDLPSLTAALLEDNRRRTEAGRKPAFIVDGERVTLVEFPSPSQLAEVERSPTPLGRPAAAASLVAEGRRACVRALRSRLADLETAGFEHVCSALLEKMGMRDVRVAKRSKEGPLYLARQRWGVSDLRVAVRLVRGRREINRQDVLELRKDLAHYSAQMAILLAPGEAGREARSDASAAAQPPVALFAGEALAEELVELRVGVNVEVVEIADVDEAFFAAARALKGGGREAKGLRDSQEGRSVENGAGSASQESSEADGPTGAPAPAAERAAAEAKGEPAQPVNDAPASNGAAHAASEEKRPDEPRNGRRPRREKEERPRMASPADQAWGQPAGTPKKSLELAASAPRPADASTPPSLSASEPAPAAEPSAPTETAASEAAASSEAAPVVPASAEPALETAGA